MSSLPSLVSIVFKHSTRFRVPERNRSSSEPICLAAKQGVVGMSGYVLVIPALDDKGRPMTGWKLPWTTKQGSLSHTHLLMEPGPYADALGLFSFL